jgi:hypothetical protein
MMYGYLHSTFTQLVLLVTAGKVCLPAFTHTHSCHQHIIPLA